MISRVRALAIIVVGLILGGLLLWQAYIPVSKKLSDRHVERGEIYMVNQEFDLALKEFDKALNYNPDNALAQSERALTLQGPVDIVQLRSFYRERGVDGVLAKLDRAQQVYTEPKQALGVGVGFYTEHDFAYARYPLELAVKLDPGYPEAWHYLGLTYQELGKWNETYKKKAEEAFATRDRLTPKYLAQPEE